MGQKFNKNRSKITILSLVVNILFMFTISVNGGEPLWLEKLKKLEVFKSTKSELLQIFNSPKIIDYSIPAKTEKNGWSENITYNTDEGELEVIYSTGKCSETNSTIGYDIDKDTIAGLTFYPDKTVSCRNLNYDLKKFKSYAVPDMGKTYIFSNDELGISIFIVDKKVEYIEFGISDKHKKLKCN